MAAIFSRAQCVVVNAWGVYLRTNFVIYIIFRANPMPLSMLWHPEASTWAGKRPRILSIHGQGNGFGGLLTL